MQLIGVLSKYHQYAEGGCLNLVPIGNNALAKKVVVSRSTASHFFKKWFGGHTKYRAFCRDSSKLLTVLKLLNKDFSPHELFGRRPAGEDDRDDKDFDNG